jgi:hypothetical protein
VLHILNRARRRPPARREHDQQNGRQSSRLQGPAHKVWNHILKVINSSYFSMRIYSYLE